VTVAIWGKHPPREAVDQLQRIADLPDVVRVAGMPDLHVAHHVAVGTVFATRSSLVPGALGGDLGCGVCGVSLDVQAGTLDRSSLAAVLRDLARAIPVGDRTHRPPRTIERDDALLESALSTGALEHTRRALLGRHLATLGGGNHFVELDRANDGSLWVLVHTGSRGLGGAIAEHHRRVAGKSALATVDVTTPEGEAYLRDMTWALSFARRNREEILARTLAVIADHVGPITAGDAIDTHHNFAAREEHDGEWLWVHRKGAIAAPQGSLAIIAGSMGTASYIVEGKGSARALRSASHGAGRVMTRTEARARVRRAAFEASMRHVVYDERRIAFLVEEAPAAYRDIRDVLDDERDLVTPIERLVPIAVLKG
jgi:tRNA-splicing ligase RtcB (3'-phosphate/5'-hydroxy nucleic acid ligase)